MPPSTPPPVVRKRLGRPPKNQLPLNSSLPQPSKTVRPLTESVSLSKSCNDSTPQPLPEIPSRSKLTKVALDKLTSHLWFLSAKNVAFSLFDEKIPDEERDLMVKRIIFEKEAKLPTINGRLVINVEEYPMIRELKLSDLFCHQTMDFFTLLQLDTGFFVKPSQNWCSDESYLTAKSFVSQLLVVNDVAERAVRLVQDYNKTNWHHENQFQDMLVTVAHARKDLK